MSRMGPFSVAVCVVAMTMIMCGCSGSSRPPTSGEFISFFGAGNRSGQHSWPHGNRNE